MKKKISAKDVCDLLNELLELDYEAVEDLIKYKSLCNEYIAKHPTVQVGTHDHEFYQVGLIGILNGLFGIRDDGFGAICYVYNMKEKRIVEFKETPK